MKILFVITFLLFCVSNFAQTEKYSRVRIFTDSKGLSQLAELGVAVDHGSRKQDTWFESDFSASEIFKMQANNFKIDILIDDVAAFYINRNKETTVNTKNSACSSSGTNENAPTIPTNFVLGSMAGFYTYEEFLSEIDQMAAAFPNLITVKAPISTFTTFQNRPIYWLKISDNPNTDETEPEVLHTSIHHAREPASLSQTIFYMWYLLENYATNPEIQYLVNNTEIFFVPMINPDGYRFNQTNTPAGGGMWRKNRRIQGNGSIGVDLNRNYSYGWNTTGVSADPDADTWPGTSAFSEPETQAMKWFCENHDFQFAFNAHTYSDFLLHPIGTTDAEFADDHTYFQGITQHMTELNGYAAMKSSGLYPASGDSDDYMYKVDLVAKPEILAMTPEIGGDEDGFWPAAANITGICQEMVRPNKLLSHFTHKYIVVKDTDPSSITTTSGNFAHTVKRYGLENGPVTVSIIPLLNIQNIGSPIIYDLMQEEQTDGTFSYILNSSIQLGDEVKYVIHTNNGLWTRKDTITKQFGEPTLQLTDDANLATTWTGTWGQSTVTFVSPSKSFTDSPISDYANNTTKITTLVQPIDLTNATAGKITFFAQWELENNFDYTAFQVSTDNGATWQEQCGLYTNLGAAAGIQPVGKPIYDGVQTSWVNEEISLEEYLGSIIKVRFILKSDGGVRGDGFYFDDFNIFYTNAPISGVGLPELQLINTHPNPANTHVTLAMNNSVNYGEVVIFDMNGKEVKKQVIESITNSIMIDLVDVPQGIYTVLLRGTQYVVKPTRLVIVH